MIKRVRVTNYLNEHIDVILDDPEPEHGLIIKSMSGLGPPKAAVSMTDLATMDGSMFNSARAEKRNITLNFLFTFTPTIEDTRQLTYKYFPIKKPVTLLIETDNRIMETTGIVESNEPDIFSKEESNNISILCEDPFFYSAGENGTNTTVFYGIEPLFEFVFSNESVTQPLLEFGSIENETEKTVYYNGDSEVGIAIDIYAMGDAGDISIYNTGTREFMKISNDKISSITGSGIIAGDRITISTVRGNKGITLLRNGIYTNILNALDRDSDWLQLAKGTNVFAYTSTQGALDLQFKITNRILYEGV